MENDAKATSTDNTANCDYTVLAEGFGEDGTFCVGDDSFHCPHCGKVYNDEKYIDRINRNKSGYTRVYCECGKLFNVVVDSSGKLHGVLTLKQVRELEVEIDNNYYE